VCIASGDKLDVFFDHASAGPLAVEVKPSHAPDRELVRGVFQCVKYRAVLDAVRAARVKFPPARAVLVTTRELDDRTRALCMRLGVPYRVVPKYAERDGS
jgi:hypothetical protein